MISRNLLYSYVALLATITFASAADLPSTKGPPVYAPPPPPVFSWTGVYIGAQVGYEWGTSDNSYYAPSGLLRSTGDHNDEGVVGGAHLGYDYQINDFVLGIVGDANGSSYAGGGNPAQIMYRHDRTDFDGSIRGRIGVAFDRVLVYATGGAALASFRNMAANANTGGFDSQTTGRLGWTVGGGMEYAIDNNWSVNAEYRYTNYGSYDFVLANSTVGPVTDRVHQTDNRAQAGFSYKFDLAPPYSPPVVSKY